MTPDPVKLIGLDKLIHPGPEKQRLALPAELDDWAQQQAGKLEEYGWKPVKEKGE